jgi:Undecaprenyl-phosphate galactose phosphotransferase WbaP
MNRYFERTLNGFMLIILETLLFYLIGTVIRSVLGIENGTEKLFYTIKGISFPFGMIIFTYIIRGLYTFNSYLIWEEIRRILSACVVTTMVVLFVYLYSEKGDKVLWFISTMILFMPLSVLLRYFYRIVAFKLKLLVSNVGIIGTGFQGEEFYNIVSNHPFSTCNVKGFISYKKDDGKKFKDGNYLGNYNNIEEIINKQGLNEIVIAVPRINRNELGEIIKKLEGKISKVKFIPDMYGLMTFSTEVNDYERVLTITAKHGLLSPVKRVYKRAFDIVFGMVGIIMLIPISIAVFIAIKLEDGGNVFFTQRRIGYKGKKIRIYKFRTMIRDAEKKLEELMRDNPAIKEEYLTNKKLENDPRITKIGNILRKTSLDEFPQFINVIKGEMSVVGPRPYLEREKADMGDKYESVILTKPGITGLWQASGRSELEFSERLVLDQYYIRNWTLWFDIVIILKTIRAVFNKTGAK